MQRTIFNKLTREATRPMIFAATSGLVDKWTGALRKIERDVDSKVEDLSRAVEEKASSRDVESLQRQMQALQLLGNAGHGQARPRRHERNTDSQVASGHDAQRFPGHNRVQAMENRANGFKDRLE